MFRCEFCEISKNSFFIEQFWVTAFAFIVATQLLYTSWKQNIRFHSRSSQRKCSIKKAAFNAIQGGGGGQKGPPTSLFPITSRNVGISPQDFLTLSFNPFVTLV